MSDIIAAVTAPQDDWWRLDAEIRRTVHRNARQLRPHPDPSVSAVAARYARSYLDAPQRARERRLGRIAFAAILLIVFLVTLTVGLDSSGRVLCGAGAPQKTIIVATGFAATALLLLPFTIRKVRISRLFRVETANRLALGGSLADDEVKAAPAVAAPAVAGHNPLAAAGLAAGYEPRRLMRVVAKLFVLTCSVGALGWETSGASAGLGQVDAPVLVFWAAAIGGFVLVLAAVVRLLVRSMVMPRPVVAMDSGGLHLPAIAWTLPWAELAEVRLFPMRSARRSGQPAVVLAFVPRDPAGVLSSLRLTGRRRRRLGERSLQLHGTPLTIADQLLNHSGAEIAAAVGTFAAVPVRQY